MYSLTFSKMKANHVQPYFLKYEGQICTASVHNVDFVKDEANNVVCVYNVYLSKMKANLEQPYFVTDEGQSCTASVHNVYYVKDDGDLVQPISTQ